MKEEIIEGRELGSDAASARSLCLFKEPPLEGKRMETGLNSSSSLLPAFIQELRKRGSP